MREAHEDFREVLWNAAARLQVAAEMLDIAVRTLEMNSAAVDALDRVSILHSSVIEEGKLLNENLVDLAVEEAGLEEENGSSWPDSCR